MECTGDDAGVEVEQYLSDISSDMTPLHSYPHFLQHSTSVYRKLSANHLEMMTFLYLANLTKCDIFCCCANAGDLH